MTEISFEDKLITKLRFTCVLTEIVKTLKLNYKIEFWFNME